MEYGRLSLSLSHILLNAVFEELQPTLPRSNTTAQGVRYRLFLNGLSIFYTPPAKTHKPARGDYEVTPSSTGPPFSHPALDAPHIPAPP